MGPPPLDGPHHPMYSSSGSIGRKFCQSDHEGYVSQTSLHVLENEEKRCQVNPILESRGVCEINETTNQSRSPSQESSDSKNMHEKGMKPIFLSQLEVDELYDMMEVLIQAFDELSIPYCIVAGTLLGAVRSHSILFNDHDIDIAIIDEHDQDHYVTLKRKLPVFFEQIKNGQPRRIPSTSSLDEQSQTSHSTDSTDQSKSEAASARYEYHHRPEEISDRITSTAFPNLWIDIFVLRKYLNEQDFKSIACEKGNDELKSIENKSFFAETTEKLLNQEQISVPFYHYHRSKAIIAKPKDYLMPEELFPIKKSFSFGPLRQVCGPRTPVRVLKRQFGQDCFTHYRINNSQQENVPENDTSKWDNIKLTDEFYLPIHHSRKKQNANTSHNLFELNKYLAQQIKEEEISSLNTCEPGLNTGGLTRSKSKNGPTLHRVPNLLYLESLSNNTEEKDSTPNSSQHSKWFGEAIQKHTKSSPDVPNFDKSLREVMEPHIRKARLKRESCKEKLLEKIGSKNVVGSTQRVTDLIIPYPILRNQRPFLFDTETYPLHTILSETLQIKDLSLLHEHEIKDKKTMLEPLLSRKLRRPFHECYDNFVTSFCIPLLHTIAIRGNVFNTNRSSSNSHNQTICYRYQAFPCIRVIRPGEFSIGPHCDMSYGHSMGNINFHIPLTPTYGTNSLFTESHPRREDWHPLTAKSVGLGYVFDGARCIHFSLENTTRHTRVSLDFRIAISRKAMNPRSHSYERRTNNIEVKDDKDDGLLCGSEMLEDRFSAVSGYYDEAYVDVGNPEAMQYAPNPVYKKVTKDGRAKLIDPDKRVGFPF